MKYLIWLVELSMAIGLADNWSQRRARRRTCRSAQTTPAGDADGCTQFGADSAVGGWLLGHEIADGHNGFPGDPLAGGHLGAPADLAFWAGALSEDDCDDTESDL